MRPAAGSQSEFTAWRDEHVLVRISLHWDPDFPGHALVIPVTHVENIYTLPDELAGRIAPSRSPESPSPCDMDIRVTA